MFTTGLLLGFILLQAGASEEGLITAAGQEIIGIGITGIAALAFAWLYFKTRKKYSDAMEKENDRNLEDKCKMEDKLEEEKRHMEGRYDRARAESDGKINVLWSEIKEIKEEEIIRYSKITEAMGEVQLQTVKALQETTAVVRENTTIMSKNIDSQNRHAEIYQEFVELLLKNKKKYG